MDEAIAIPGTNIRVGWDAMIGLIPVIGDIAGLLAALYFVRAGYRLGLPKRTLSVMYYNIGLELLIGTIPIAGDIFDAQWKANRKNYQIIDDHLQSEEEKILAVIEAQSGPLDTSFQNVQSYVLPMVLIAFITGLTVIAGYYVLQMTS